MQKNEEEIGLFYFSQKIGKYERGKDPVEELQNSIEALIAEHVKITRKLEKVLGSHGRLKDIICKCVSENSKVAIVEANSNLEQSLIDVIQTIKQNESLVRRSRHDMNWTYTMCLFVNKRI